VRGTSRSVESYRRLKGWNQRDENYHRSTPKAGSYRRLKGWNQRDENYHRSTPKAGSYRRLIQRGDSNYSHHCCHLAGNLHK
jgi:hypothetical protein